MYMRNPNIKTENLNPYSSSLTSGIRNTLLPPPVQCSMRLEASPSPILHTANDKSSYEEKRRKLKKDYDDALEQLEDSYQNSLDLILSEKINNFYAQTAIVELCRKKKTKKEQIERIEERLAALNTMFKPSIDLFNIKGQVVNDCLNITSHVTSNQENIKKEANEFISSYIELLRCISPHLEQLKDEIRFLTNRKEDLSVELDVLESQFKLAYLEQVKSAFSSHEKKREREMLYLRIELADLYKTQVASLRDEFDSGTVISSPSTRA